MGRRLGDDMRWLRLGAVLVLGCGAARAAEPPADWVLFNGRIFTSDPARLHAQALAIRGERIVAVGDDATVKPLAGRGTRVVDLQGRTVVPGLDDAHSHHLSVEPPGLVEVETKGWDPTWPELQEALRAAAAKATPGQVLLAPIGPSVFGNVQVDGAALDAVVPAVPVVLGTFDGHAGILNGAALRLVALGPDVADPAGGRIERSGGRLTGVFREYAHFGLVFRRLAALATDADMEAAFRRTLRRAPRFGLTSIQELNGTVSTERTARVLARIGPSIRVRLVRMNTTTAAGPDLEESASTPAHPSPLVTVSGTKWLLDGVVFEGSLTPRTSVVAQTSKPGGPYSFAGLPPLFGTEVVDALLRDGLRRDSQLHLHAFGTPAARQVLDALDRTGGAQVWARRRVRIEHGDGLTPELIARAKALGVVVSQQGMHVGIVQGVPALGAPFLAMLRAEKAQPLRSLLAAGVPLALGSDGPMNPWLGILGAVTHPDRPEEALTREQAVVAYTAGSAYAAFAEADRGTLTPGKLADLAVLSQDVFTVPIPELPKTVSVLTLVGGKVAYEAEPPVNATPARP